MSNANTPLLGDSRDVRIHVYVRRQDFQDTYRNLTYKGVAALRWISRYCSHARYVLKTDDDIFVNAFNLLRHLRRLDRLTATAASPSTGAAPRGLLLCLVWYTMTVMREGKWKVSRVIVRFGVAVASFVRRVNQVTLR